MKKILITMAILLILPFTVFAENLEDITDASIKVIYKYGETSIPKAAVKLYKVASLKNDGSFVYETKYTINDEIKVTTPEEVNALTKKIKDDINSNSITPDTTLTTSNDGETYFGNLESGLYLVEANSIKLNTTTYTAMPTLVIVPSFDETTGDYTHHPEVLIKVEAKEDSVPDEPEKPDKKEEPKKGDKKPSIIDIVNPPNTVDKILVYTIILASSLLFILVIITIIQKIRKGDKHEKNN